MNILVLTDIHGKPSTSGCLSRLILRWAQSSVRTVSLSELLNTDLVGKALHRHLVESDGFARAAECLVDRVDGVDVALGYSAGGMLLWQSVLLGLSVDRLICISSTRLRQVTAQSIPIPALAVFGERDENRPPSSWAVGSSVKTHIIPHSGHDFYDSRGQAWDMCLTTLADFLDSTE